MYPTVSKMRRNGLICGITHCEEETMTLDYSEQSRVRETSEIQAQ